MKRYPFEEKTPEELARMINAAMASEDETHMTPEEEAEYDAEYGYEQDAEDFGMSCGVYFAVSEKQAAKGNTVRCIMPELPDARRIYLEEMDSTPDELCVRKQKGWCKEISVLKENVDKVLALWYSEGEMADWNVEEIIDSIEGNLVYFIGFGD